MGTEIVIGVVGTVDIAETEADSTIEIISGGVTLSPPRLWFAAAIAATLVPDGEPAIQSGDRVVMLTRDRQTYYVLERVVPFG